MLEYTSGINSAEVMLFSEPGWALPNELLHYRKNCTVIGVLLEFCGVRCSVSPWGVGMEGAIPRALDVNRGVLVEQSQLTRWWRQRRLLNTRSSLDQRNGEKRDCCPKWKTKSSRWWWRHFTEAIPETNCSLLKMSSLIEIKDTACAYDFPQLFKKKYPWLWI